MTTISIDNAEHYRWGDGCDGWHLVKTADLSVIRERVPAGAFEVRHYHEKAEQFFYVLTGIATLEVNGTVHEVGPGQGMHVPAGQPHQLRNDGSDELVFLVISTPPSHGDRVTV